MHIVESGSQIFVRNLQWKRISSVSMPCEMSNETPLRRHHPTRDHKYVFYLKANTTFNALSAASYTVEYLFKCGRVRAKALLPWSVHKGPLVSLCDTVGNT